MNFCLNHLADALVLLKEYQRGYKEVLWLIEAHLRRADYLIRDDNISLLLRSIDVGKSENLDNVLEVYNKVAQSELEADQKCSGDCGYVEPPYGCVELPKEYKHVCGTHSQDLMEEKVSSNEEEKTGYPDEDEDEIEFSFERV